MLPTESAPKFISTGTKLLSIQFRQTKYIDSHCFIPMPLSAFPKTFGLTELKKGKLLLFIYINIL